MPIFRILPWLGGALALLSGPVALGQDLNIDRNLNALVAKLQSQPRDDQAVLTYAARVRNAVPSALQAVVAMTSESSQAEADSALDADEAASDSAPAASQPPLGVDEPTRAQLLANYRILAGNLKQMAASHASADALARGVRRIRSFLALLQKIGAETDPETRQRELGQALVPPPLWHP